MIEGMRYIYSTVYVICKPRPRGISDVKCFLPILQISFTFTTAHTYVN